MCRHWRTFLLPYFVGIQLIYEVLLIFGDLVLLRRTRHALQMWYKIVEVAIRITVPTTENAALSGVHICSRDVARPKYHLILLPLIIAGSTCKRRISCMIPENVFKLWTSLARIELSLNRAIHYIAPDLIAWLSTDIHFTHTVINGRCWFILLY